MAIKTFTAGSVLTASDTNTYLANSGLVYVASGDLTGTSTIATNCFSSTYTNYRVLVRVSTASGGEAYVKLRNSGGTSSASYDWGLYGVANPGGAVTYAANANPYIPAGGYTNSAIVFDFYNPFEATPTYFNAQQTVDIAGTYYFRNYGGRHTLTTSYTSLDFQAGSNMTGKYFVYGYRIA